MSDVVWTVLTLAALALAAGYVWMGATLQAVFAKLELKRADAWVPIYRYVQSARAGRLPTLPVWIARSAALVCWTVFVSIVVLRAANTISPSKGLAPLASTMFAVAVLASLVAWAVWIVSANRIELRLVVQSRLTWVAALLPPLWATLVGYGSARPAVVGPVVGAAPAPPVDDDDATRAIQRVAQPVPEAEPVPQEPATQEVVEDQMTTDEHDITGKFARAYSPYDASRPAEEPAADTGGHIPPWAYDDDDATFFAKRRRARWVLRVVGGEEYDLEDVTTIGREGIRPIPGVLPIMDDTRTVSKLHARLRRESDNWFITDLGSTNGTFVRDSAGTEVEVKAQSEAKVEGTLLLGDLELVIVDQREDAQ
ncbi:FHA domain-containing protein [Demequina sp.]|uniref:FHA domain-containing protein n=1 Tax=Demequina sp. TaxID=2050685 RepID=UPI003D13A17C